MKIVFAAINAKYIHSNLAVYSLQKYALEKKNVEDDIIIKEYTINQFEQDILRDIYMEKADLVVFSCYIWNIKYVISIARELKLVDANVKIWAGGPEVSYDAKEMLQKYPFFDLIMCGEGEETFSKLLLGEEKSKISGIAYRKGEELIENPIGSCIDMDELSFVYDDLSKFEHKILYYETSRGCPFSCSYCLSSIDKTVRFRSFSLVKKELDFFLENKVKQVKFVDRTFNCNKKHAMDIWTYLRENDNGVTNFHFEVSADLLDEEELSLLAALRPGLIQLEIGVQSTNKKTIEAIRRKMDLEKLERNVMEIHKMKNIHQHLDLIAGLPYEDYESFKKSFDDIYRMKPQQLQLGFLKVLKGSYMHEMAKQYGLVYQTEPVYEVYKTNWISYDEILELKGVEEMVEVYYNSNQFTYSLAYLQQRYDRPFYLFKELADYYKKENLNDRNHTRIARYEILMKFAFEKWGEESEQLREILLYDLYARENLKSRPEWATCTDAYKKTYLNLFKSEEEMRKYVEIDGEYDSKKAARKYHIEPFSVDIKKLSLLGEKVEKKQHILFDYDNKSPLTAKARTVEVKIEEKIEK